MRMSILLLGTVLTGCAPAMDRITATDFEPTGPGTFKFKTLIAPQYPDNPTGEAARMEMLQGWLTNYVVSSPNPSAEIKARYPLAEGKVKVEEIPGSPGSYNAVAWLRPWLQMEELTSSMRLVAKIPAAAGK